jgi:SAM-dependent methyltransferase
MATEIVNVEQAAEWDGPGAEFWVNHQARLDATISPHHTQLMAAAAIQPGERILDVGCGNGLTSRDAARAAGEAGEVLGVDLSGPMLAVAERTAKEEGLGNVRFERGDAQVYPFPAGRFDLLMSRFGVMFFADPVAAFANMARAVRPGGRLTMLVWGPVPRNEWILALRGALVLGRELPPPPPGAPGPFTLADEEVTSRILTEAGFTDMAFTASEQPFNVGPDAGGAFEFIRDLNMVRGMLEDLDEAMTAQALDNLRAVIDAHVTPAGVVFDSCAWVVTARKPGGAQPLT